MRAHFSAETFDGKTVFAIVDGFDPNDPIEGGRLHNLGVLFWGDLHHNRVEDPEVDIETIRLLALEQE